MRRGESEPLALLYGGMSAQPTADGRHLLLHRGFAPSRSLELRTPLPREPDWFRWRLSVNDDRLAVLVNDVPVHEQRWPSPAARDPWLLLTAGSRSTGEIRNLNITGEPVIPEVINLSRTAWLGDAGWSEDLPQPDEDSRFRKRSAHEPWSMQGDELVRSATDEINHGQTPGVQAAPSLLRYHRPMFEDGAIQFDFQFTSDESCVHPVLGDVAFEIRADGVASVPLEQLSRESKPAPSTTSSAPPLRLGDWNSVSLTLAGDQVSIRINGRSVHTDRIPVSNDRRFGLLHDAKQSAARVRNIHHRGHWPKRT